MRLNELYDTETEKSIFIIGGQHGDEPTGIEIAKYFLTHPGCWVLPCANIQGLKDKTREWNNVDLNRSFGDCQLDAEQQKIVDLIKTLCKKSALVIDVHSTFEEHLQEPLFIPNQFAAQFKNQLDIECYESEAPEGSLRWFCDQNSIPMITYEAVEKSPVCDKQIQIGISAIKKISLF